MRKLAGTMAFLLASGLMIGPDFTAATPVACIDPLDPAVVCAATRPVSGSDLGQFAFTIENAGTYEVDVVDFSELNPMVAGPLGTLAVAVVAPPSVVAPLAETTPGALRYFFQADTYYAQVFAVLSSTAQSTLNGLKFGMYGLSIRAVQVVPLPASVLLLGSAVALLGARLRRSRG